MPQHDPTDPFELGRSPRGGDAGIDDDQDFWGRSRRARKEDKRARRGRKRGDTPPEAPSTGQVPAARRPEPPPSAPPPAQPREMTYDRVGPAGRSSRMTPWASSRRAADSGAATAPGGRPTGQVPQVRGPVSTGQVPQVRGSVSTGQVPQARTRGPVTSTGQVPQPRGVPGTGRVPVDQSIQGVGRRVTRRTRSLPRSTGWDTPPPPLSGASARQAALPAGGDWAGGAADAGRRGVYDRVDGLAARATPPGGYQRTAVTELAPAVTPGQMAQRAIGTYDDSYDDAADDDDAYGSDEIDEYGPDRSRRRGCGRLGVLMLTVAAVVVMSLVGAGLWVRQQITPGGPAGEQVVVTVSQGQSTGDIGQELEDRGVITNASVWTWYVRFQGGGHIQAGEYSLRKNMSMGQALDALTGEASPTAGNRVTIPEGLTVTQMKARLLDPDNGVEGFTAEGLDAALADPALRSRFLPAGQSNLEGTLFPETYALEEDGTEATMLRHMVDELDSVLTDLDIEAGAAALGRTPYEVLIVASLVEEEARVAEERPQVARVIYNRLGQDHPLQIDATSCYAKGEVPCRLTAGDLASDSPYNTRHRAGLPPTPISAPGRASIEAALSPAAGDWLYYVLDPQVDPNGERHLFTSSEEEFIAAKDRCAQARLGCG